MFIVGCFCFLVHVILTSLIARLLKITVVLILWYACIKTEFWGFCIRSISSWSTGYIALLTCLLNVTSMFSQSEPNRWNSIWTFPRPLPAFVSWRLSREKYKKKENEKKIWSRNDRLCFAVNCTSFGSTTLGWSLSVSWTGRPTCFTTVGD